jgi:hypothetical protein
MILSSEQVKKIVAAGGGVVLDASALTFSQLKEIAEAAHGGNAAITLRYISGLTAVQLHELAAAAPRLIVFDFVTAKGI